MYNNCTPVMRITFFLVRDIVIHRDSTARSSRHQPGKLKGSMVQCPPIGHSCYHRTSPCTVVSLGIYEILPLLPRYVEAFIPGYCVIRAQLKMLLSM